MTDSKPKDGDYLLESALIDTTLVIDGLHGTEAHQSQYKRTVAAIRFPCASSYTKFEYVRKLGQQIRLAYNRLVRGGTLTDTIVYLNTITSRARNRGPAIAINVLLHTQSAVRTIDPGLERRKALASLRLQAEQLAGTFEKRSGLDLRDGSRCHYQSMVPWFTGNGHTSRMHWPKITCLPANLRCSVHEHLRAGRNKMACNEIEKRIKALPERTKEQENLLAAVKLSRGNAGPTQLARHDVCLGIGDLVIFMDSLDLKNAITTNYKEWSEFNNAANVRVILFSGNPDDPDPKPFGPT